MMKNKIKLKKFLFLSLIITVFLSIIFLVINVYEYHVYNKNLNIKIATIITSVQEKYPNITEDELINILNNDNIDNKLLDKYSIDINKDSILLKNEKEFHKFMIINSLFYIITIIILILMFLRFNSKKDNEINKITKCIEEINKKNYKLDLDEMSEDELSILKNEIYKTTLMLKEQAENYKKEKFELKDSLSNISHQLKTPLTSILIALDNLIDDPDMEKEVREDFIRDIKRETTNITFLVQSILKLSKLDTNTVIFIEKEVYIKDILEETIKNLAMLCDLKNVNIKLKIEDNPKIKCDFKWQVEAISNIVKNCIEYSYKNTDVLIEVSSNKVYEQIKIKDNGIGIDKKDLPHIFERFYKAKNATNESIGIGLSLAKTIIEKANGTISVDSNNDGTEFTIKYFK